MKVTNVVLALALSGFPAAAQEAHHDCPQMTGSNDAHAALNTSGVSDEQRSHYLNGEGMGLAKAADSQPRAPCSTTCIRMRRR